jgi:gamma-D-glutamyl-L-lysine dipeptidyl-peptidase
VKGRIAVAVAPIRREPAHESECVSQALHGETFEIVRENDDGAWQEVRLEADGYRGWLRSWYGRATEDPVLELGWVRGRIAEVREKPARGAALLAVLPWPARLHLEEDQGPWTRARLADGRSGYVLARQAIRGTAPGGKATAARLVKTASSLLGAPYLWGGRSAWGFDCSGLIQAVFAWHGAGLPRDSQQQWNALKSSGGYSSAREADPSTAPAGSLIFFGADESRITHVALSAGNGEFLHAYGQVCRGSLKPSSQRVVPELVTAVVGTLPWTAVTRAQTA